MRVRKRKGKPIAVLIAFIITFVICTVLMFVFPKKTTFYNNRNEPINIIFNYEKKGSSVMKRYEDVVKVDGQFLLIGFKYKYSITLVDNTKEQLKVSQEPQIFLETKLGEVEKKRPTEKINTNQRK